MAPPRRWSPESKPRRAGDVPPTLRAAPHLFDRPFDCMLLHMGEQARAERRFEEALAETGATDPREGYRELLRELKTRSEERYADVVRRWKEEVIAPLARGEGDALERWLEFGAALAEELHPGRTVVVDETGRAAPLRSPPSWTDLILHLPDERRVRAVPVSIPPEPSSAQRATVDLLVEGRLRLPDA